MVAIGIIILSNKAIKFVEMLPDPKTNQPMPLMEFQKFIVGSLYGWRRGQYRMFTKAYIVWLENKVSL